MSSVQAEINQQAQQQRQQQQQQRVEIKEICPFFSTLPDEMVTSIFSYLNVTDVLGCTRSVDRRFRRLSFDAIIQIHLGRLRSPDSPLLKPDKLIRILPLFPRLRFLNLSLVSWSRKGKKWEKLFVDALRLCQTLEGISAEYIGSPDLFNAIKQYGKSLRKISLKGVFYLDATSFRNLTHVKLVSCYGLDDEVLLSIGKLCGRLERITCHENCMAEVISAGTMKAFLSSVKGTLKSLDWNMTSRNDKWISYLSQCQKLEEVNVTTLHKARPILEVAARLPLLKHLGLGTPHKFLVDTPDNGTKLKMSDRITSVTLVGSMINGSSALNRFSERFQFPGLLRLNLECVTSSGMSCIAGWCGRTLEVITVASSRAGATIDVIRESVEEGKMPRLKWVKIRRQYEKEEFHDVRSKELGVNVVSF